MIDKIPIDLIWLIADFLSFEDALHLCWVNKAFDLFFRSWSYWRQRVLTELGLPMESFDRDGVSRNPKERYFQFWSQWKGCMKGSEKYVDPAICWARAVVNGQSTDLIEYFEIFDWPGCRGDTIYKTRGDAVYKIIALNNPELIFKLWKIKSYDRNCNVYHEFLYCMRPSTYAKGVISHFDNLPSIDKVISDDSKFPDKEEPIHNFLRRAVIFDALLSGKVDEVLRTTRQFRALQYESIYALLVELYPDKSLCVLLKDADSFVTGASYGIPWSCKSDTDTNFDHYEKRKVLEASIISKNKRCLDRLLVTFPSRVLYDDLNLAFMSTKFGQSTEIFEMIIEHMDRCKMSIPNDLLHKIVIQNRSDLIRVIRKYPICAPDITNKRIMVKYVGIINRLSETQE